jgi:large subunit ribosomal protein L10
VDEGGGEELNRDQKAQAIAEIASSLSSTDTVIATSFHGLSVRQVEDLRGKLREADGRFQVVKNTLARRACAEAGTETLVEYLEGQTALVWAQGDAAAIAKTLATFGKAAEDRLTMKGGILDGAPITAEELKQLAALPPRDELLARLVGGVASPLQGTANALGSLISGMARALGAYHAQRASEPDAQVEQAAPEAAAQPVAEDAPVAEAEVTAEETTTEETPEATPEASADDTPEAAQEPAADDTTDAEPAADETTEGDS